MSAESLRQVVELFPGPALIVRPCGEVVGGNGRLEPWIGLDRDALPGSPLARLVAEPPERVAGFLEDCSRGGRKVAGAFTPLRGDAAGAECRVEGMLVQSHPGEDGRPLVVVHVILADPDADENITDRERAHEAPLEESLPRDDLHKDEFLSVLAHELRNSVAAFSGALHLARTANSEGDVAWAENSMDRQLKSLVRLIDDLLDFSRITRGKIELRKQRLDAAAVVRAAVESVRPLIDERDHQFLLSTSPEPLRIDADPGRLEQVLVNVLSHAAKSTNPGGHIGILVAREQDSIAFRIRDHGNGIPPAILPRCVDQSPPVGRSIDISEGGLGIGLMLAGKLVEMHGGSASVWSGGPGERSEFTVRLPAVPDSPSPEPGTAPAPAAPAGARILIVDDNVDTARGLARLLQLSGYDVQVAHDGRRALELARDHSPAFVLLDIGLPDMDGYEVARQLRGDPRFRDTIVVGISGYGEEDDLRRSHSAGFDHHLVKPVDYNALRALLNRPAPPRGVR